MNAITTKKAAMQRLTASLMGAALLCAGATAALAQQKLQPIKYGFGNKAVNILSINLAIPEILGYYKEDGLTVDIIPLGADAVSMAMLQGDRVQFSTSSPSVTLPILAQGEKLNVMNVMEFVYPFKYQLAVRPDSPYKTIDDLKGKTIGVPSLGVSEYPFGQSVFRAAGQPNVNWLAVGENVTGGEALRRGDIDALFGLDVGFGAIEAAGIKMRYIPMPPTVPKIGGIYLQTRPDIVKDHRNWAVGMIRGILKANAFITANPEAAAYEFIQMFPEAAPKGMSLEDQVKAVMVPVVKRAPLLSNDFPGRKQGYMNPEQMTDEINFAGVQSKVKLNDALALYSNDMIDEANNFDVSKIIEQAKNFPLPYKKK